MLPYTPSKKSTDAIINFYRQSYQLINEQWHMRQRFLDIDRAYQREHDLTEEQWKVEQAQRRGDPTKYRNITMPVVMPKVEAAVTYQQSVFLSGFPIFGVVAPPEHADAATQMDTLIGEQQIRGKWVKELLLAIRNGFKYNLGPIEVSWEQEVSYALTDPAEDRAARDKESSKNISRQRQVIWEGNKIKALDVYNTFYDTRVTPDEIPDKGEFAGYIELYSRIALKKLLAELPHRINVKEALESARSGMAGTGSGATGYYVPRINPEAIYENDGLATTNWLSWAHMEDNEPRINYSNLYEVTTLYARILPSDFAIKDVPGQNTPQVWKFIIVNDSVVIYAERMTNSHNLIPIIFAQPQEDGLGYQTKSLAKNMQPFQEINTALTNSIIAARRRSISDRMLYDPSRISGGAIGNDNPVARIPVRPSAFGTSLSEAVYQIPFEDTQSQFAVQFVQQFSQMANETAGLNPARQGNFVKGNKTRFEFAETMGYANGRDETVALTLEDTFFSRIKQIIKANILQYQGAASVYNRNQNEVVRIDPVTLRKANLEFMVSDGKLPADKLIDGDTFNQLLQAMATAPQLAQQYNIGQMISYLAKSRGADIQGFEKSQSQLAYEQAVGAWQQVVATLAEQIANMEQQPTPEQIQQMLPPQPQPQQFGYNPESPKSSVQNQGKSVYGRYAEVTQQAQSAAQAPATAPGAEGSPSGNSGQSQ